MILHHKDVSPYSEKIRLMLGYTGISWQGVQAPLTPPRPSIDPLVGGYRRIPVAQIGADVFCDTDIIADEIAHLAGRPDLSPYSQPKSIRRDLARVEGPMFFACVASVPVWGLIRALLREIPLRQIPNYLADKKVLAADGGDAPRPSRAECQQMWQDFLLALDQQIAGDFMTGATPTILDFSTVHLIWFRLKMDGPAMIRPLDRLHQWYRRMMDIGHGQSTVIDAATSLNSAGAADPRPVPAAMAIGNLVGQKVTVTPTDYGRIGTTGILAGEDHNRWIVSRHTDKAGHVHVHLPRRGYDISIA